MKKKEILTKYKQININEPSNHPDDFLFSKGEVGEDGRKGEEKIMGNKHGDT